MPSPVLQVENAAIRTEKIGSRKETIMRRIFAAAIMIGVIGGLLGMPARSSAQSHETYRQHRDKERNKWRDLAIASGAVGIIGILNGNDTLTAVGVGGAAYSAYRYSEDGKRYAE